MKGSDLNPAEACPSTSNSGACPSASPCVCVLGLGYVGLPLAQAFSKTCRVIGFDTDSKKVEDLANLNQNDDYANFSFTDNAKEIGQADFVMICVPTPVTKSKEPDLSYVRGAARTVSQHMKRGSTVILESTVYPGVTEEVVKPIPKTRLTDKQLQMFKEMLYAKRRELSGDVRTLTQDALGRSRQDSSGDLSSMPIHMADIGSDNWEQDFTIGLIANEQQLLREIDEACARIEDRTYGVCLATYKPIGVARLRAKPWAKYCIEYAREREMGGI